MGNSFFPPSTTEASDTHLDRSKSPCQKALFSVLNMNEDEYSRFFDPSYDFVYGDSYPSSIDRKSSCGYNYYPPIGWNSFALKVTHYESNLDWLKNDKWATAFHCVGSPGEIHSDGKTTVRKILEEGLKPGQRQQYQDDDAVQGGKVGTGVYFSPKVTSCAGYSGGFTYDGKLYKLGFLCRINQKEIRIPKTARNCWVVPNTRDIRPYKIIVKEF